MSEQDWYYLEESQQKGPMRRDQLLAELGRRLPPSTLVWRDGLSGWLPADQVSELAAELRTVAHPTAPPPVAAPGPPARSEWDAPAAASTRGVLTNWDDEPRSLNLAGLLQRSFRWSGRFNRMEFFLGCTMMSFAGALMLAPAMVVDAILGEESTVAVVFGGLVALVALVILLIGFAGLTVRRLHDLGQSGWLALLALVPCAGAIMWVWLSLAPGARRASSSGAPVAGP